MSSPPMPIKAEPTNAAPNAAIQSPAQDVTKPLDLAGQRKKQLTLMRADVQKLAYLDLQRPFTNLEDAVDRLLPFHILASEEAEEADFEEADAGGAVLLASRPTVWNEYVCTKAQQHVERAETLRQRAMELHEQHRGPKRARPEYGYLWEKHLYDDALEEHNKIKMIISQAKARQGMRQAGQQKTAAQSQQQQQRQVPHARPQQPQGTEAAALERHQVALNRLKQQQAG